MKRSNKLSVAALSLYFGAWVVGLFGATGVSNALVVIAALMFLAAVVGYLFSGLASLFAVLNGDKELKLTRPTGRWDDGDEFVDMQTGVGNDVHISAVDNINRNY